MAVEVEALDSKGKMVLDSNGYPTWLCKDHMKGNGVIVNRENETKAKIIVSR
jgi:hypothetical protein